MFQFGPGIYIPTDPDNRAQYGNGTNLSLGMLARLSSPGSWVNLSAARSSSSGPTPLFDPTFESGPSSYHVTLFGFGALWNLTNHSTFDHLWIQAGFGMDVVLIHVNAGSFGTVDDSDAGVYVELQPSIPLGSRWRLWADDRLLATGSENAGPAARYNFGGHFLSLGLSHTVLWSRGETP